LHGGGSRALAATGLCHDQSIEIGTAHKLGP